MQRHRRTTVSLVAVFALVAQALVAPQGAVRAADPVEVVFGFTGSEQVFVVPDEITTIRVLLRAGHGGGAGGNQWGFAHELAGDIAVTPGQTLYVQVGGVGGTGRPGGFNGGGNGGHSTIADGYGGGGASDIRTISRHQAGTLASRLMVAAGGGGGGGGGQQNRGGHAGGSGVYEGAGATGGGPGTADSGGGGGAGSGTSGSGSDGAAGSGGTGGDSTAGGGGGGGGGGWFGGGGGGAGDFLFPSGAGGGGGSSYFGEATNTTSPQLTSLSPMVLITYTPSDAPDPDPEPSPGSDSGALAGTITAASEPGGPCLIVGGSSIDFGTHPFNDGSAPPVVGTLDGSGESSFSVENCGDAGVELLARGTDATSRTSDAAWALQPITGSDTSCTVAGPDTTNVYGLVNEGDGSGSQSLSTSDTTVNPSLAAGDTRSHQVFIQMPCVGSDGAGETFDLTVTYTAIEP